ncbi:MAG: VanZ family protein, partial [Pseudomonadota bacterium]
MSKAWQWSISVALLFIYLFAGLYPFAWQAPTYTVHNSALRTSEGALRFAARGIALTNQPPTWVLGAIGGKSLSLELELRTYSTPPLRTTRIFALVGEDAGRNFVVDQQGIDLVVRMRKAREENESLAYHVHGVFAAPRRKRIAVTFAATRLNVSMDDKEVFSVALERDPFLQWSPDCRVVLGNSLRFNRPWLGEIRKALVRSPGEAVDYAATGMLEMPGSLTLRRKDSRMRLEPFDNKELNVENATDWVINLVGFMPLGIWIVYSRRPRRSLLVATVVCAALSLGIENLLCYLDERSPSIDDFILNTLGGALGAYFGHYLFLRRGVPVD